jgi:hypothetical protein
MLHQLARKDRATRRTRAAEVEPGAAAPSPARVNRSNHALAVRRRHGDIHGVSGFEPETVEQTFERLRRAERSHQAERQAEAASRVADPELARQPKAVEYPVPAGNPVHWLQEYEQSWKPDALVVLHPEMFGGGGDQTQVEVAVFGLAVWGLVRLSLRTGWRRFVISSLLISRVDGLSVGSVGKSPGSIWASDAILAKVYDRNRGPTWSGKNLYEFKPLPRKAAVAAGMASKQKDHWWKPASTVPEPEASEASVAAAKDLAERWAVFGRDYPGLRKAITAQAKTPDRGG